MHAGTKAVTLTCSYCHAPVISYLKDCISCGNPVGFPNVRAAENEQEQQGLQERYGDALISAESGKYRAVFDRFGIVVSGSQAVLARNLLVLDSLVSNASGMMPTFYKMVRSSARVAENNSWDRGRTAVDSTINPMYHEHIHCSALSLDGKGLQKFGAYSITLKEALIKTRSTVFEENPFKFLDRMQVSAGKTPPPGYRAAWTDRGKLAQAKLFRQLTPATKEDEFPGVLLRDDDDEEKTDYVEVHTYGPLHRSVIERVIGPVPKASTERAIWRRVKKQLTALGAQVEEL